MSDDHGHGHGTDAKQPPKTETPGGVWLGLIVVALAITVVIAMFIFMLFEDGMEWALVLMILLAASTTEHYIEPVAGYMAGILLNERSGKQRVLFQGGFGNGKLPWEHLQKYQGQDYINLRTELQDTKAETWTALDSEMVAEYIYTIRVHWKEQAVLKYASFHPAAIKAEAVAMISRLLSDDFTDKTSTALLNKTDIYERVFGDHGTGRDDLQKFEEKHGVDIEIDINDVDRASSTQEAQDIIAKANAFNLAVAKRLDGIPAPTPEQRHEAEEDIRQFMFPNFQRYRLDVNAPDLQNMTHLSVLGGLPAARTTHAAEKKAKKEKK